MTKPTTSRVYAGYSALAVCSLLTANVFAAESPPDSDAPKDEAILLSPFVVDTSRDVGYRATNTLAGSRINTPLKDVANAITVVTKDFFNDVSAVDVNDILSYTPGTEGIGQFVATANVLNAPDDLSAANRQTANRIRGLDAADISRDYFATVTGPIGFDTYNLDQVTINRGPNSVLFGQGSAAGLINYSPQLAGLSKNSTELTYRYGSFHDQRATLNANIAALPGQFAVRVAGAWNDHGFRQQPAHDRDTRFYTAVTYKPFSKTTIRANYEHIKRDVQAPNSFTPADYVTAWLNAGRPVLDYSVLQPVDAVRTIIYDKTGKLEGARQGVNSASSGLQFNPLANAPAGFYVPGISDNRYYNVETTNTYSLTDNMKSEVFEISIDQEILPHLNLNLAYVNEKFEWTKIGNFRTPVYALRLDNVTKYQDGSANPHFGELYHDDWGANSKWTNPATNENGRATLTYDLDLRDRNKWFGRYVLTGFMESRTRDVQANIFGEHPTVDPTFTPVNRRYYVGGGISSVGGAVAPATAIPHVPELVKAAPLRYLDATTGSWTNGTLSSVYVDDRMNEDINKLNTRAFVGQAYFWDDKIVGTVGVRHDVNSNRNRNALGTLTTQSNNGPYGDPLVAAKQTVSYGVVVHPLKWLSLHYSKSENFKPNAGTVDLLGVSTPAPSGEGKDYGVSVDLFDDRLNVKLNWFEMAQKNGFPGQPARILAQWQLPFAEYGVMGPMVEQQLHLPYKYIDPSPNHVIWGDGRLENGSYTADNTAKGVELEMTYNVTKNWRVMANVTKQEAQLSNIATGLTKLVDERLAYWKSIPGLLSTLSTTNPWGIAWTGQDAYNSVLLPYLQVKAQEGQPSNELSKYRFNGITNYTFSDGALRGLNIGGGVRVADRPVIGNPYVYQSGITGPVGLDLSHPYRGERQFSADAWVGYRLPIYNRKYILSFQLNARDLQSDGGLEVVSRAGPDPNGNVFNQTYRIKPPRTYFLTTRLEF